MADVLKLQNFINGEFVEAKAYLDSFDPSRGEVWAKVPDSSAVDVNEAVGAAKVAFPGWRDTPKQERARIANRIADLLESRLEEFAERESRDQGKPISLARTIDIPRAVYNFRFYANDALHTVNRCNYQDHFQALNYESREPVGVAGLISPWNLPLYLLTFKIAPAIVLGNTCVCKPSEMTSVTAWMLCRILNEAGLPKGVVNMVFGTGWTAGDAIICHPDVRLVSFTGSGATAEKIRQASLPFPCRKLSLELGGKNPGLIFDDADLEKCIPTTIRSCFANQGEICLCIERIYVQRGIFQTFLDRFVKATRALKVGDPRSPDTFMGALVSKEHLAKVKGYISRAKTEGATICCGEGVDLLSLPEDNAKGYFMAPTVITDVSQHSAVMQEEVFGPVTCVVPFDTEEEAITCANDVQYGLCATVWSQDVSRVHRVAKKIEAGTVWCNCWMVRDLLMPFGGMKASGSGREGSQGSLDFYTEQKTICVQF